MDLSIVLVSWNTRALLVDCLNSLKGALNGQMEVLVVDNASDDDTVAVLKTDFPWVKLIENGKNVGFASGNNQAIRQSIGDYVLLLNPDTVVLPGALDVLLKFMTENPGVGAVGSRVLNPDGTLQTSCYPAPTLPRELWRLFHLDALWPFGVYRMTDWPIDKNRQVDVLLGACILLRREVLDQIGLLDEKYFMYSEEVDLCYRVRRAGWLIFWAPEAKIIHYGGQSTNQVAGEMFLRLYEGKLIYFKKHYGRLVTQAYKLVILMTALSRLVLTPLAWLERPPQRRYHLALAGRYWRLVMALPDL
jgi:GT2 family glycosyltransferase